MDKRKVAVGEIFTYTIKASGSFSSPELITPEFKNFTIVSQSQSKNFSLKKGQIHMDFSVTYSLFAPEPGVFLIEAPQIKDTDTVLKGKPIKIKVRGKPLKEQEKIRPFIESATDI
ncbi:MAG: BatD family protein [Candidatus Omnitrophota bacterium]|nr:MAG: BatD family protein [Candidatus Omnitrophota bacterium]